MSAWHMRALEEPDLPLRRGLGARLLQLAAIHWFAWKEFNRNFCLERAASLSFATVISLIPLAVLFFSFAVQLGKGDLVVHEAKEKLFPLVAPDFQAELSRWLDENISTDAFAAGFVSVLGLLALVTLIISAFAVVVTAERSFNRLWKVRGTRTYLQKLIMFWTVLTTSPFLLAASASAESFLLPTGGFVERLTKEYFVLKALYRLIVPLTIGFIVFTILYRFLPAARVRMRSAALGGVATALLWEVSRRSFSFYLLRANLVTSFYGSLGVVPVFLLWIYLNWVLILWGCEISYAHQNLADLCSGRLERQEPSVRAASPILGVSFLEALGQAFFAGKPPPPVSAIAADLGVVTSEAEDVARTLVEAGFLVEDLRAPGTFVLARAPEAIRLTDVIQLFEVDETTPRPRAGEAFREARAAFHHAFDGKTLATLVAPAAPGGHS
ncbi:MAG TPA: YhjD/YihY/BrkB family envelope integrity protein [Planctomycetota bacterium]|nr:YhjD/YihY/BrkB family envelope integrity protein [Planctomycetota bacterium]